MKRITSLIIGYIIGLSTLIAQSFTTPAQVVLKNGSIINGTIISQDLTTGVKIKNSCGDIWFFSMDEVENIIIQRPAENDSIPYYPYPTYPTPLSTTPNTGEIPPPVFNYHKKYPHLTSSSPYPQQKAIPYVFKSRDGFSHNHSAAMLIGRGVWETRLHLEFTSFIRYYYKPQIALDFGLGLSFVERFSFPLFLQANYLLKDEQKTGAIYLRAAMNAYPRRWDSRAIGSHYELGYSFISNKSDRVGNSVDLFYRYTIMKTAFQPNFDAWNAISYLNRFGVRVTFMKL